VKAMENEKLQATLKMDIRKLCKEILLLVTIFVVVVSPFWKIITTQGLPMYAYFYLHPEYRSYIAANLQGYDYYYGLGGATLTGLTNIIFFTIFEFLHIFTNSFEIAFKLLILFCLLLLSLTIYSTSRQWLDFSPLTTIIFAILIVYSPYAIMYASLLELNDFFDLSWSLLLLLCGIEFIESKNYKFLPLISLFSFLSSEKIQYFILFSMAVFVYWFLVFVSQLSTSRNLKILEQLFTFLFIAFSMFAGTLYLILSYILNPPESLSVTLESAQDTIKCGSSYTSPVRSFVLLSKLLPNLSGSYASAKLYSFMYSSTLMLYIIVITAFLSLIVPKVINEKGKRVILLFSFLYIFGVLWYNGNNPPIPIAYYLVKYLPFSILRSTVHMWVLVTISLSILVGYFMSFMRNCNRYVYTLFAAILLLLLFVKVVSPIVLDGTFFGTSPNIQLPKEYEETIAYFHSELDNEFFRIFIPKTQSLIHYSFAVNNAYENDIFFAYWVPNVHFLGTIKTFPLSVVASYFDGQLNNNFSKVIPTLLGIMNIKYVVLDKNIIEIKDNIKTVSERASNSLGPPVKSFENITIYKNPNFVPLVYVPNQVILANFTDQELFAKTVLSTTTNEVAIIDDSIFNELKPCLEFKEKSWYFKNSPTLKILNIEGSQIKIQVYNVTGPFLLVLSSNYDKLLEVNSQSIKVATHYKVNDFANAWLVVPKENVKEMTVEVAYTGNLLYLLGFLFSLSSPLIVLSFVLIWAKVKNFRAN